MSKSMSIRGIIFSLISHRAIKVNGVNNRKGVSRTEIVELAKTECGISPEKAEKALIWLDSEGYIKLHRQCAVINSSGWKLAERYVRHFKKWYKEHKPKTRAPWEAVHKAA